MVPSCPEPQEPVLTSDKEEDPEKAKVQSSPSNLAKNNKIQFSPSSVPKVANTETKSSPIVVPRIEKTEAMECQRFIVAEHQDVEETYTVLASPSGNSDINEYLVDNAEKGWRETRILERQGIFDRARASNSDIEWSSEESAPIHSPQHKKIHPPSKRTKSNSPQMNSPNNYIKKGAWSEAESQCLLEGVDCYGEGKWKEIKASYPDLRFRTTNQLKDKYRNIKGRK